MLQPVTASPAESWYTPYSVSAPPTRASRAASSSLSSRGATELSPSSSFCSPPPRGAQPARARVHTRARQISFFMFLVLSF